MNVLTLKLVGLQILKLFGRDYKSLSAGDPISLIA